MTTELRLQFRGIILALMTAVGCVAYERLVKRLDFAVIAVLTVLFFTLVLLGMLVHAGQRVFESTRTAIVDPELRWWALVYVITWATSPIWFYVTKEQSVLAGSLYEVKYIVLLALFYALAGQQKFTWNLVAACVLAAGSVALISKK